jgi:hypothetical protein
MHVIWGTKFIVKIREYFFRNSPIHKHTATFFFIKFEREVYEIYFFIWEQALEIKCPEKNLGWGTCAGGFNHGVKGLISKLVTKLK